MPECICNSPSTGTRTKQARDAGRQGIIAKADSAQVSCIESDGVYREDASASSHYSRQMLLHPEEQRSILDATNHCQPCVTRMQTLLPCFGLAMITAKTTYSQKAIKSLIKKNPTCYLASKALAPSSFSLYILLAVLK